MIIIVDDTFLDRHKFHEVDYLAEEKYTKICNVYTKIKTTELGSLVKFFDSCKLFCNHKTLQLYDSEGNALNNSDNSKMRENLINRVIQKNINRFEFSRGLETNFEANKIDKDLFYTNLRNFLDYFLEHTIIEPKILYWGENFIERERFSLIQKMMIQIRVLNLEDFGTDIVLLNGLTVLFQDKTPEIVIDEWIMNKLSKNEIISIINQQI